MILGSMFNNNENDAVKPCLNDEVEGLSWRIESISFGQSNVQIG